jgi:hypothetical protein
LNYQYSTSKVVIEITIPHKNPRCARNYNNDQDIKIDMFMKEKKGIDLEISDNDVTMVDAQTIGVVIAADQPMQGCYSQATEPRRPTRQKNVSKHSRIASLTSESLERRVKKWGVWRADSDACLFDMDGQEQCTNSLNANETQSRNDMTNYFFDQLSPSNGESYFHQEKKTKSKRSQQADGPRRPSMILAMSVEGDGPRRPSLIVERPTLGDGSESFEKVKRHTRTAATQLIIPVNKGQSLRVLRVHF